VLFDGDDLSLDAALTRSGLVALPTVDPVLVTVSLVAMVLGLSLACPTSGDSRAISVRAAAKSARN
jgi:hypothetical protein